VVATLAILGLIIPSKTVGDAGTAMVLKKTPLDVLTESSTPDEVKEAIVYAANNTGADPDKMKVIANCESTGYKDICILDTNNKYSCGFFMFQQKTLEYYCPDLRWGKEYPADNVVCAARMFAKSINVIKSNWVICSQKWLDK